jgi:hypothetical protein
MNGYMGIFVADDTPPVPAIAGNDDGLHCSTCELERAVDNHDCNVCSRNWGNSGCRLHTEWRTKRWA